MSTRTSRTPPLPILFITPEIHPLIKTGGLGEVSAALPAALKELGVNIRVLVPGYPQVLDALKYKRTVAQFDAFHGFPKARLLRAKLPTEVPLLILDCPELYRRNGGPYGDDSGADWPDNALRFGLLGYIGALLCTEESPLAWRPRIVHGNDWQSGLVPAYLHFTPTRRPFSVMTLHNLAFQGIFPPETIKPLGLPPASFHINGVEFHGKLSFLKAGLYYADRITTVSPTYAREIQSKPLGFGLQGLLSSRRDRITGILNGIDIEDWNPGRDKLIPHPYSSDSLEYKAKNKAALQRAFGLEINADVPLFGLVSRITEQKGIDLLIKAVPKLLSIPAQIAVVGMGDQKLEQALLDLARGFPRHMAVQTIFSESLSHLVEAGSDIFLMPSRFEPCGLNQMYSQRYGTPPVAHATGGLVDSIVDGNGKSLDYRTATGFLFDEMDEESFFGAVKRAVTAYRDKPLWRSIQKNGMARDFSWKSSAEKYLAIYQSMVQP